jgi:hypothetical protein
VKRLGTSVALILCIAFAPLVRGDDASDIARLLKQQEMIENWVAFNQALDKMMHDVAEKLAQKTRFDADIAQARSQFWATYPGKPGVAQARTRFSQLLNAKDLYYMMLVKTYYTQGGLISAQPSGAQYADPFRVVEAMDLGKLDNGIPQRCKPEFLDWVDAIGTHLRQQGGKPETVLDFLKYRAKEPQEIDKAVLDSVPTYKVYVTCRDWAEFDAAGREPAGASDPVVYGAMLFERYDNLSMTDAAVVYISMAKILGLKRLEDVARRIHQAPKSEHGELVHPEALGLQPTQYKARINSSGHEEADTTALVPELSIPIAGTTPLVGFIALTTNADARSYLLGLLAKQSQAGKRSDGKQMGRYNWQYAATTYNRWVISFGESKILKGADQVRTARKRLLDGAVADPGSIGAIRTEPYSSFQDIVVHGDPQGYVRMILSSADKLDSAAAVDDAYSKLVSTYGAEHVSGVGKEMAFRSGYAASMWPAPELPSDFKMLTGLLDGSQQLANSASNAAPRAPSNSKPCTSPAPARRVAGKGRADSPATVSTNPCPDATSAPTTSETMPAANSVLSSGSTPLSKPSSGVSQAPLVASNVRSSVATKPPVTNEPPVPPQQFMPPRMSVMITTIDSIDIAAVNAGRPIHSRVASPVVRGSQVFLPVGTEVLLKTRVYKADDLNHLVHLAVSLDSAIVDGKQVPLYSRELIEHIHPDPVTTWGGPSTPTPPGRMAVQPNTRLIFSTTSETGR